MMDISKYIVYSSMYPGKRIKEISQRLVAPQLIFGGLFIGLGAWLFAPYMLFAGIWCIYQFFLWLSAIKKKAVQCLPLYQIMDERLTFHCFYHLYFMYFC